MITKEINDLFTSLVRARLFLPNADGAKAFFPFINTDHNAKEHTQSIWT